MLKRWSCKISKAPVPPLTAMDQSQIALLSIGRVNSTVLAGSHSPLKTEEWESPREEIS